MSGGTISTALSVIFVGPGLTLNGSTLSATAGVAVKATRTSSGNTQCTGNDYYIGYTGPGANTFTFVAASVNQGIELVVKNEGSSTLTLDATGAGGFWGTSLVNTWTLHIGSSVRLISDGTNWVITACAAGIIV